MAADLKKDAIYVYCIGWVLAGIFSYWAGNSFVLSLCLAFLAWFYVLFAALRGIWQMFPAIF